MPAFVLGYVWLRHGHQAPDVAENGWAEPLSGFGGREHPTYATYSLLLALCFGTMGLPHVLVRFYTNPDGRAARRTTTAVVGLLGAFYVFVPLYGVLGQAYLPVLPDGVRSDLVSLYLPGAVTPGLLGDVLSAMLAGGAFAAFLSTASGLTISVSGVLSQDILQPRLTALTGGDSSPVQSFRLAAVVAVVVPVLASTLTVNTGLADTVGMAFAVAASTFCPMLVLGIWWRRLSVAGAVAGLATGGTLALAAVLVTVVGGVRGGWTGALLAQPAAWTVPIAFAVTVVVSLMTKGSVPRHSRRTLVRLHAPEALALERPLGG